MITNKIKSLLALKGFTFVDYANIMKIAKQSLNNKAKSEAYKARDLIALADLTNTDLCFVDKDTGDILMRLDSSDIKKEPTPK